MELLHGEGKTKSTNSSLQVRTIWTVLAIYHVKAKQVSKLRQLLLKSYNSSKRITALRANISNPFKEIDTKVIEGIVLNFLGQNKVAQLKFFYKQIETYEFHLLINPMSNHNHPNMLLPGKPTHSLKRNRKDEKYHTPVNKNKEAASTYRHYSLQFKIYERKSNTL